MVGLLSKWLPPGDTHLGPSDANNQSSVDFSFHYLIALCHTSGNQPVLFNSPGKINFLIDLLYSFMQYSATLLSKPQN